MTHSQDLTHQLGGRWDLGYGTAPCPICQPERRADQNALTLHDGTDGRLLVHCKKSDCAFADILTAVSIDRERSNAQSVGESIRRQSECRAFDMKRARQAESFWQETRPLKGTSAETYPRARAITCELPSTLQFHPAAWHGPTAGRLPCLVALVDPAGRAAAHALTLRACSLGWRVELLTSPEGQDWNDILKKEADHERG